MKFRKSEFISLLIVILSFIVSWYFYPALPEKAASHWNAQGEVNGYVSKFWGAFLMPIIGAAVYIIFLLIPRIDPRRENIQKFRSYFDGFIVLLLLFFFYLHGLTLAWNLGSNFDMVVMLIPAFFVLFFYVGVMLRHAEMNWTIGIRTPWTLSSEKVWKKTHLLGGRLFQLSAIISLIGILFPNQAIWLLLIPIIASALGLFAYSYFLYRREEIK
ncbi:MAG: DUF1648 domain-containing protein [Patescibacteria group bacterium]|jgi:uncharacterized membrane protein